MDCLIIYCHPYDKSFNHAVLENVENNLKQNNINYYIFDINYPLLIHHFYQIFPIINAIIVQINVILTMS